MEEFLARAVQLYEQEQGEPFGSPLLKLYVECRVKWLYSDIRPFENNEYSYESTLMKNTEN